MAADNYGSMYFSQSTGRYGYSYDYPTLDAARRVAYGNCKSRDCRETTWFRNACAALAVGDGNAWGSGWAASRGKAERKALGNCRSQGSNCSVRQWVCTTR